MSNPLKPALQCSGQISLKNVANEFLQTTNNISLSSYQRGAGIVKNIYTNRKVPAKAGLSLASPTAPPIMLSNLYCASYYFLKVQFAITSETPSTYGNVNNGSISVTVWGVSDNFEVKCNGSVWNLGADGSTATFSGLNATSYSILVSDLTHLTSYTFTANVGYGSGNSVEGYDLDVQHVVG